MIILEPVKIFKGTYQYCIRNNFSDANYLYDLDYSVHQLNMDFELSKVGILPSEAQAKYNTVSFHPSDKRVAVILKDKSIAICDFDGNILNRQTGVYENLIYSRDGEFIWAIEKPDKNHLRIFVFDKTMLILEQYEMEDELYDSHPLFSDIPKSHKIILELAAGQDGVSLYECEYKDSISIKEFILSKKFPKSSFITPAWSPNSLKMLALENDMQTYASFTYPEIEMIAQQTNDFENEEQAPGYNIIYLKNGLAIVQNANYRYFLFDPINMKRLDEIVLRGYEPVPASQIYKNLKHDCSLCSRIVYFNRIGGNLLAARTDERHDEPVTILIDEDSIIGCTV